MPATVIVGLQWGDEGKGKATDFLAGQVSWVVRYQGGDNAGHTIVLGSEVFKLHLVPSGVLYPHIVPLIGPGVVVNPPTLIGELDALTARGVDTSRVRVSHARHVSMPYHVAEDRASEARPGRDGIGTTNRGIGPAYADRASRVGLRMEDVRHEAALRRKLGRLVPDKNAWLAQLGDKGRPFAVEALVESALSWGVRLRGQIADTTTLVQDALRAGDHVLLEGAQGTLLDLDHGSYPFVTSSNPVAGGACTGGGIGPLQVSAVIGIMKAYTTRVGAGPYPTELLDAVGEGIAMRGHEFGTTTGRRRRVGWFDAVPLRYAVDVNSVSSIILNKLDILSGIDEIRLCVAYDIDGRRVERWPASAGVRMARADAFAAKRPAVACAAALDAAGRGIVIKADGLAAGKGVTVCETFDEALAALDAILGDVAAGSIGVRVVVEERLRGPEVSVIVLADETAALVLPAARDHKRLGDGDAGPNTGGMGAYSPLPDLPDADVAGIVAAFHVPLLAELARRGTPFRGALYAGLILTDDGPLLLECNARFGDPEAQVILPRCATPLVPLLLAAAEGRLAATPAAAGITGTLLPSIPEAAVGIVLAAAGYPSAPRPGDAITRLIEADARGGLVVHAGTARDPGGTWRVHGGRVLTVVGTGPDLVTARAAAELAADAISFEGLQRRHDIAAATQTAPATAGRPR